MKLHPQQVKAVETRNLTLTETPEGVTAAWTPSIGTDWLISETRGNAKDAIKAAGKAQDEAFAGMTDALEEGEEAPSYEQFLKVGAFVAETEEEAAQEGDEEAKGGVVPIKYRNEYKARGTPRGNGDAFFHYMEGAVGSGEKLDIAALDALAVANGVDNSKYDRSRHGWQGRLRMTTGNMLRSVLRKNAWTLKQADGTSIVIDLSKPVEAPAQPEA